MDASQSVALVIIAAVFLLRKQIKGFLRKPDDEEQAAERFEEDEAVWEIARREKRLRRESRTSQSGSAESPSDAGNVSSPPNT